MTVTAIRPLSRMRWSVPTWPAVFAAVGTGIALAIVSLLLVRSGMAPAPDVAEEVTTSFPIWAQLILLAAVGPLVEEALFRGWLPLKLRRIMPDFGATVSSAIVFALIHWFSPVAIWLLLFAGGIIFSALARRFDNLVVPTIAHCTINLIAILS